MEVGLGKYGPIFKVMRRSVSKDWISGSGPECGLVISLGVGECGAREQGNGEGFHCNNWSGIIFSETRATSDFQGGVGISKIGPPLVSPLDDGFATASKGISRQK